MGRTPSTKHSPHWWRRVRLRLSTSTCWKALFVVPSASVRVTGPRISPPAGPAAAGARRSAPAAERPVLGVLGHGQQLAIAPAVAVRVQLEPAQVAEEPAQADDLLLAVAVAALQAARQPALPHLEPGGEHVADADRPRPRLQEQLQRRADQHHA